MWSADRLAARRSDRSSASAEARNSATSIALRSALQACRRACAPDHADSGSCQASFVAGLPKGRPAPAAAEAGGGRARIRDLMNAWYDAKDLLTGGSGIAWVVPR